MKDNKRFKILLGIALNAQDNRKHLSEIVELFCLDAAEPRTWTGLTLEEIKALAEKNHEFFYPCDLTFALAIVDKLKEKNT